MLKLSFCKSDLQLHQLYNFLKKSNYAQNVNGTDDIYSRKKNSLDIIQLAYTRKKVFISTGKHIF